MNIYIVLCFTFDRGMELKYTLMLCLLVEFVILQFMLLTEDDVVVAATSLGFISLTGLALGLFLGLYIGKYGRMRKNLTDYLVANDGVGMEKTIPGFSSTHIKDINEEQMAGLQHRVPVSG